MANGSSTSQYYVVCEVHNFGGFFGGDTVTLTATPWTGKTAQPSGDERELTIDEKVFANVRDRYTITAGMLLALQFAGERVERAEVIGVASHAELRAALGPAQPQAPLHGIRILSYYCDNDGLWVAGEPEQGACRVCGRGLGIRRQE